MDSLIAGFFTNSLNDNDLEKLNRWLEEDESHREEFGRLRSCWIMAGYETGKKSFDARRSTQFVVEQRINGKTGRIKWMTPLWYAASLLFCFALGATVTSLATRNRQAQPVPLATAASTTISVPLGAKTKITLPDSSSVWLNAGSTLSYSSGFGLENRDLQLTGEAFFDVKSNPLKPFNVHTAGMTVKATGTRFNVRAYPNDPILAATLEEGIVDVEILTPVEKTRSSVRLKPKEQLVIHKTEKAIKTGKPDQTPEKVQKTDTPELAINEVVVKPNVNTVLSTSWKDPKWIIRDEPLALFAENLERRYNLQIHFASEELKEYNFSGTFENETVEQILTALSLAAPVNYKFNKNHVELSMNYKDKAKFTKILKIKK